MRDPVAKLKAFLADVLAKAKDTDGNLAPEWADADIRWTPAGNLSLTLRRTRLGKPYYASTIIAPSKLTARDEQAVDLFLGQTVAMLLRQFVPAPVDVGGEG